MSHTKIALSIAAGLSLIFTVLVAHAAPPDTAGAQSYKSHKALLIGLDGMQYEKLQQAMQQNKAPHIASLNPAKSYTGGIGATSTEQTTGSGPGWTTILTGTWVDRHKVPSNNNAWRNKAPSLFKQLKQADPERKTSSIVSWNTINNNFADDIAQGFIDLAIKCSDVDQCVADKASYELEYGRSDLVFAHFDEPDNVGHRYGFSTRYQTAIQGVDDKVGQLLSALKRRKQSNPDEDWLVLVTTDHGRRLPDGRNHGAQTLSEKTTFIALNKPANEQLTRPITNPDNPGHDNLYGFASQADITPTLLAHFGIEPVPARHAMDGLPLTGPLGARLFSARLAPDAAQVNLTWNGDGSADKPVHIYRNGKQIASVDYSRRGYIDNDIKELKGPVNYTAVIDKVPVSRLITLGDKKP